MLKQTIEDYLLWMIEAGYHRKTCREADIALGHFHDFVHRHKIPIISVFTHSTLGGFEKEYTDKCYAVRHVRGLWRYLFRNGVILEPPMKKKQLPDTYEEYLLYYGRRVLPGQVQHALRAQ